jgi:hypothetical protein
MNMWVPGAGAFGVAFAMGLISLEGEQVRLVSLWW